MSTILSSTELLAYQPNITATVGTILFRKNEATKKVLA
jgi:hypothetical protein